MSLDGKKFLDNNIDTIPISRNIIKKLNDKNIHSVYDLWLLKRKDLKEYGLIDNEINNIIVVLQLQGLDLNKKAY